MKIIFNKNLCCYLKKCLKYPGEVGIPFYISSITQDRQTIFLKTARRLFTTSSSSNKCITEVPGTIISAHTHPVVCYTQCERRIGWPSGDDFYQYTLGNQILNLVIAKEGIYTIKKTKNMTRFLKTLSNNRRKRLAQIVREKTLELEQREYKCGVQKAIRIYLEEVNRIESPPLKGSLFSVNLHKWSDLQKEKQLVQTIERISLRKIDKNDNDEKWIPQKTPNHYL